MAMMKRNIDTLKGIAQKPAPATSQSPPPPPIQQPPPMSAPKPQVTRSPPLPTPLLNQKETSVIRRQECLQERVEN